MNNMMNKKIFLFFLFFILFFLLLATFSLVEGASYVEKSGASVKQEQSNSRENSGLSKKVSKKVNFSTSTSVSNVIEKKLTNKLEKIEDKIQDNNKTTKGQLISALNQVQRLEFQNLKVTLRQIGYHGEVDDFAVAFNKELKRLKVEIKEKLNASSERNLTRNVMLQVAKRELSRIRAEKMEQMNLSISPEEVNEYLVNITEIKDLNFTEEIRYMNQNFKNMITEIAKNGTLEEKKAFKEQIRKYIQNRKTLIKLRLRERAELLKLRRGMIREMLRANKTSEDIVNLVAE